MISYEEQLDRDRDWALREGSMHFDKQNAVHKTLARLATRLDQLGVDYAVAGSMAMFTHGYRRFTEDVDVLVTAEGLARIHEALDGRGYVRPFAASRNLRDAEHGVRIDFLVSGQYPGDGSPGPITFPVPADASVEVDGIRYLDLRRLNELKLASGRASHRRRDLADVQEMIRSLRLPQEFGDDLDRSVRDAFLELWLDAQKAVGDEY
jgi:hypothetical protein